MQSTRLFITTQRCLSVWKRNAVLKRYLSLSNVHIVNSNLNYSSSSRLNSTSNSYGRFLSLKTNGITNIPIRFASSGDLPSHKKITLPALSPTMETGTLRSWAKQEGEKISEGDILAEIETDKATLGFEAGDEGYLAKIIIQAGSKDVPVGKLCAIIVEKEEDIAAFKDFKDDGAGTSAPPTAAKPEKKEKEAPKKEESTAKPTQPAPKKETPSPAKTTGDRVFASPLARKLAKEKNIDLSSVQGTGPNGRIVAEDIEKFVKEGGAKAGAQRKADQTTGTRQEKATPARTGGYDEQQVSNLKAESARRAAESKSTIPHYYLNIDVELDEILQLRQKLNDLTSPKTKDPKQQKSSGLTINDFVVKAAALACRKRPETNSVWMENSIRQYETVDINFAINTDAGVVVTPILYNVEQKGLSAINKELSQLSEKANSGDLNENELETGTFTITDLGQYGVTHCNAVIYPQQSAILAIGGVETKILPAPNSPKGFRTTSVLNITLACDHRVIDGAVGAQWLQQFKQYLENPGSMIL